MTGKRQAPKQEQTRLAWERSQEASRERRRIREHLSHGGSLSLILWAMPLGNHPLGGVPVETLVRWIPGVGEYKAHRITQGVPSGYTLRMLTIEQRQHLARKVGEYERGRAARLVTNQTRSA